MSAACPAHPWVQVPIDGECYSCGIKRASVRRGDHRTAAVTSAQRVTDDVGQGNGRKRINRPTFRRKGGARS